ncbi:MAG: helix-turn-helix transcriptional regulator [Clostridia bacterium]|nr:helix-turn-helix transcriptional regulator [Clostridia bacterium]
MAVSNASISYWETGKQLPSAEVIFKLAQYFEVSADFLLGLTDWD